MRIHKWRVLGNNEIPKICNDLDITLVKELTNYPLPIFDIYGPYVDGYIIFYPDGTESIIDKSDLKPSKSIDHYIRNKMGQSRDSHVATVANFTREIENSRICVNNLYGDVIYNICIPNRYGNIKDVNIYISDNLLGKFENRGEYFYFPSEIICLMQSQMYIEIQYHQVIRVDEDNLSPSQIQSNNLSHKSEWDIPFTYKSILFPPVKCRELATMYRDDYLLGNHLIKLGTIAGMIPDNYIKTKTKIREINQSYLILKDGTKIRRDKIKTNFIGKILHANSSAELDKYLQLGATESTIDPTLSILVDIKNIVI